MLYTHAEAQDDDGTHVDCIASQLAASSNTVRALLEQLVAEGIIYATVSDNHFAAVVVHGKVQNTNFARIMNKFNDKHEFVLSRAMAANWTKAKEKYGIKDRFESSSGSSSSDSDSDEGGSYDPEEG